MSELERWEARFAAPGYHFGTEPNAFLKSKADLLKRGQKALSIADGEGRNGVFLASLGPVSYTHLTLPTIYSV